MHIIIALLSIWSCHLAMSSGQWSFLHLQFPISIGLASAASLIIGMCVNGYQQSNGERWLQCLMRTRNNDMTLALRPAEDEDVGGGDGTSIMVTI